MIGIYKITSPTNRVYIGQSIDIETRFNSYKRIDCKTQRILYKSLLKYGVENHKFEIICECSIPELNDLERYYQDLYSVIKSGLNCILTKSNDRSGVGIKMSDKQKKQVSEVHKGKKVSLETRNKIKMARAKQVITEAHKKAISENSGSARIVLDTNTGIFYNSAKEAAKYNNIKPNSLVCRLIGKVKNKSNLIYV